MQTSLAFHAAYPVLELEKTIAFYTDVLGCNKGRSDTSWVDFNLFGHQIVFHKVEGFEQRHYFNPVDKHNVPVPHFGVVLDWQDWQPFVDRLNHHNISFEIEPHIRFQGQVGEQATMFFYDPNHYALEFKSFRSSDMLFAT
ncbi:MAG: glyoxalase [Rickettsiales bacterium]|nr:glyoxalase [Actinomycetota bacterium]MBA94434.1 glyoxalase [Rickettsiales bacterium]|tara:strand:- start:5000 stop:5422 length:423 start_codon:yes stop_codon:yes gene_type:complete